MDKTTVKILTIKETGVVSKETDERVRGGVDYVKCVRDDQDVCFGG